MAQTCVCTALWLLLHVALRCVLPLSAFLTAALTITWGASKQLVVAVVAYQPAWMLF
jgi:hypothetical protein